MSGGAKIVGPPLKNSLGPLLVFRLNKFTQGQCQSMQFVNPTQIPPPPQNGTFRGTFYEKSMQHVWGDLLTI